MAYDIQDFDRLQIYVTDGWREWYIPKLRIYMTSSGDFCYLYWTDTEKGRDGYTRLLTLDYNDVTFGYLTPSSASEVVTVINSYIISSWTDITDSTVSSVTDDGNGVVVVDNTIPTQPVIQFAGVNVDGVTVTGDGSAGNPLVSHYAGGANLWAYIAKTTITSGDPGQGHIIWDNATQTSATQINLSHLTDDGFDIDLFFNYFAVGDQLIIQDRDDSSNYQIWDISASVTIIPNSYVEVPVTLDSSGGTGTTNFSNNQKLLVAKFGVETPKVESVTDDGNGAVTVDNTDPLNPVIGFSAQVDGLTIDGDGTTASPLEAKFVTLAVQSSIVPHTGTAAETILYSYLIPGGTIGNNDKLMVHAIFKKNSGSGGFTVRARLHTANAVAGTPIGNNVISTAGNTARIMSEQWWQNDNNSSIGFPTGGGSFQSTWGANYVTTALDNTADIYVLITGQLATSGDTAELSSARVELYKY